MKKLLVVALSVVLGACTTIKQSTNVSSNLQAMEFNSVASQYMDRPTFVEFMNLSDGSEILNIKISTYGKGRYGDYSAHIGLNKAYLEEDIALINKYFEWEIQAKSKGDIFTKEIGRARESTNGETKFTFHSGNASEHYLALSFCAKTLLNTCLDEGALYFNVIDAKELVALLEKLKAGDIKQKNIDAAYK